MFKKHPRGLGIIFFTEMWERFGFYILMAVLVLYMDAEFHWDDARKGTIYGTFLGAVYFIPILGGWLGDRILGHLNTIRLGAVSLAVGYAALSMSTVDHVAFFFAGLAFIAFGTGIFKANMAVVLGRLYDDRPALKDAGFNLYYMSVNVGATIAPLAATALFTLFASHRYSFMAAVVGLILAIVTFESGHTRLRALASAASAAGGHAEAGPSGEASRGDEDVARVLTLVMLFSIVIFFWTAFYQNGFAQTLFAERSTRIYKWLRPETYQFFEPFFILLLTPLLIGYFERRRAQGREVSNPVKIATGMFVAGFAMLVMSGASAAGGNADRNVMSPFWLITAYFIITIGEILVSPMGLSFVSKVAPRRLQGLMMGLWFGATALGSYGSGLLGRFYGRMPHDRYFLILAALLFGAAAAVVLSLKRLSRFSGESAHREAGAA